MTPSERLANAERAKAALTEFLEPAITQVEQEYAEKMIAAAASSDPRANDIIARLANGVKVARQVRAKVEAIVLDGALAESEMNRSAQISKMSAHKRAIVGV